MQHKCYRCLAEKKKRLKEFTSDNEKSEKAWQPFMLLKQNHQNYEKEEDLTFFVFWMTLENFILFLVFLRRNVT